MEFFFVFLGTARSENVLCVYAACNRPLIGKYQLLDLSQACCWLCTHTTHFPIAPWWRSTPVQKIENDNIGMCSLFMCVSWPSLQQSAKCNSSTEHEDRVRDLQHCAQRHRSSLYTSTLLAELIFCRSWMPANCSAAAAAARWAASPTPDIIAF